MLFDKQVSVAPLPKRLPMPQREMSADVQRVIEERAGLGFWELAPLGRAVKVSGQTARILNLRSGVETISLEEFAGCMVPADRKLFAMALEEMIDKKTGFEAVLRLYFNGDIKVTEIFCDVVTDAHGGLTNIVGTLRDITKRMKVEVMSKGRAAIMRVILRNIPSAVAVLDQHLKYLLVSDHWLIGHSAKSSNELLGQHMYDVVPAASKFRDEHQRVLGGETIRTQRAIRRDENGKLVNQKMVICPWYTSENKVGGLIIMLGEAGDSIIPEGVAPDFEEQEGLLTLVDALA